MSVDAYYSGAVAWVVEQGVTEGTDESHFSPNAACTRAQTLTFLWRAAGSPEPAGDGVPFTDVAEGSYYEKAMTWAVENGIAKGVSETLFAPDRTVTRAQAAAFLYRFAQAHAEPTDRFDDVAADAWYAEAVAWAVERGVTQGTGARTFSPNAPCNRGQLVTFLFRLMEQSNYSVAV